MAALKLYFDESGTHKSAAGIAIAGYVASTDSWLHFSEDWSVALKRFGVSCFHMTDWENRRGEFKGMKERERKRLYNKLVTIIHRYAEGGLAASFHVHDFQKADLLLGSPYIFCSTLAIAAANQWAETVSFDDELEFVFEKGAETASYFKRAFEAAQKNKQFAARFRLGSISYADRRRVVPLQAADILAYETYKKLDGRLNRKTIEILLNGKVQHYAIHYKREDFDELKRQRASRS